VSKLSPKALAEIAEQAGVTVEQAETVLRLAKAAKHSNVTITGSTGPIQTGNGTQIVGRRQ
jgi:anaerobic selenocysteine-containing dehydrogenase